MLQQKPTQNTLKKDGTLRITALRKLSLLNPRHRNKKFAQGVTPDSASVTTRTLSKLLAWKVAA